MNKVDKAKRIEELKIEMADSQLDGMLNDDIREMAFDSLVDGYSEEDVKCWYFDAYGEELE